MRELIILLVHLVSTLARRDPVVPVLWWPNLS